MTRRWHGMTDEEVATAKRRRAFVVDARERGSPMTFQEIGDALGITRCRARQLYISEVKRRA